MNGTQDPTIIGLQNVFLSYKEAIINTSLSGPTLFQHVLKALLGYVQKCLAIQMYHVMMIITDGEIHDMRETIDVIVELSKFPVSIIIIGVGQDEFENMQRLDGDKQRLRSSSD